MTRANAILLAALVTGLGAGAALVAALGLPGESSRTQAAPSVPNVRSLAAEIETIQSKLPDQSHAMKDVGYHFTNLWFAGQKQNWDLANFYWTETRSHLRWAVRIIPKRKDNAGREIDLQAILQSLENSPLKELHDAIAAKDKPAFEKSYRVTIENCYACHKAADKPYIRLQVPNQPEVEVVNFDPNADWPK